MQIEPALSALKMNLDECRAPVVGLDERNLGTLERAGFREFFVWLGRGEQITGVCAVMPLTTWRHGAFAPKMHVSAFPDGQFEVVVFGRGPGKGQFLKTARDIIPPRVFRALRAWAQAATRSAEVFG